MNSLVVRVFFSLIVGLTSASAEVVIPSDILPAHELIKVLRSGGYIIYMRHGLTDRSFKRVTEPDLDKCNTQRNLSTKGIEQLKDIMLSIRTHKIPVGTVLSSPYCRCKDTAQLVFGEYQIEPNLGFSISKDKKETSRLAKQLHQMMLDATTDKNNAVFVGHSSNLKDSLGVWPKPEGVVAVFQKSAEELIFKGFIKPSEW